MKPIQTITVLLLVVLAAGGGWLAARKHDSSTQGAANSAATRKVLYYQSPMHPWIKSDKPGRCTICGMELAPVFEGDKGAELTEGMVTLGSNAIRVINVQTEEVKRRPLTRSFRFAGTIEDNDAAHRFVSAYVDGRIDRLAVNFVGAEVVQGEPLATLYSPMLLAAEREYLSVGRQATAAGPGLALEHRQLMDAAGSRLKQFGLSDTQIAALPDKDVRDIDTALLAPLSGTVVARFVYEGQYVKEGDKLFEIADFSTMWFLFDAYERDLAWLKPGQPVVVTTPSAPGRTFAGNISFIDPNLKEMTRSAKVRVELSNPLVTTNGIKRRELYHKLYAEGVVTVVAPEVLAVPRSAVLSGGTVPVVYLDRGNGAFEQRRLHLGRSSDDTYEVLDGLSPGEKVVTQGNLLIDAQTQLNAGVSAGANAPPSETNQTAALPPLTTAQQAAAREFISIAAALASALAADSLTAFNTQSTRAHAALPMLLTAFTGADNGWREIVGNIEASGHLMAATDLKDARKMFHPLSQVTVVFAKALRSRDDTFSTLRIFRCPMTKDAFPGAPRTGEWLQLDEAIHNPYFGAEMLDCGSEVKP